MAVKASSAVASSLASLLMGKKEISLDYFETPQIYMGGILWFLNFYFTDLLCDEWSAKSAEDLAHKIYVYSIYSV